MRGKQALDAIAARLEVDLRTRFPEVTVRFVPDDEEPSWYVCDVREPRERWGFVSTWVGDSDDLDDSGVEMLLVEVASDVCDNLWPDDGTEPWPLCPEHRDHPLNPVKVRGTASWSCSRELSVAIRIGTLR